MPTYFEGITEGTRVSLGSYELSVDEVTTFAEQFDPQPYHTREGGATDSVFDELVASGLQTLCLSIRLFVLEYLQKRDVANMGGHGMDELRWPNPVRPGDSLHVEATVLEKRVSESRPTRGDVDYRLTTRTEANGDVMSVITNVIVGRDPDRTD